MIVSSHGIIGSQIVQINTLLDLYPNAAAAYSLRKLRTAYTGSAIRVRRASDSAESDIGFSANQLDTSALTTFANGGNVFVKTWYDQSGNARNATQETAINQPQIVSSGSVILDNGNPSVQFTTALSQTLRFNGLMYTTNTVFATAVFSLNSSPSFSVILSQNSGEVGRSNILSINDTTPKNSIYFFNNGTSFINLSSGTISDNTQTLMTNFSVSNNYFNALNGGSANNIISGQSFTPVSFNGTVIGGQPNNFAFLNGKIQEIVVYNFDQSTNRTGIEDSINDFYSIY